jgi:integrase
VCPEGIEIRPGARSDRIRISFNLNGRRHRETLDIPATAANIKYAARLRAEVLNAIERGTFDYTTLFPKSRAAKKAQRQGRAKKPSQVGELVDAYLDAARAAKVMSPSSIACYARWGEARVKKKWGDTPVDELATAALRPWVAELAGALAPKSARNCVALLSTVLDQAVADGFIAANPLDPIKLKRVIPRARKGVDDDVDPFNDTEVSAIIAACDRPEERALFQFAFAAGLRTGELIALKWDHLDRLQGYAHVCDNVVDAEIGTREKDTKTGSVRDVPLLPAALEAIATMRPISQLRSPYVFTGADHQRWASAQQIRNRWRIVLRRAGVRYRNPYQTRHTFASRLLMAGERELLVAYLLGHSTVEMVRRHYGRYIRQPDGVTLAGDYSGFGASAKKAG